MTEESVLASLGGPLTIGVRADAQEAAEAAAALIAEHARAAVRARGRFVVAVSGGRTPWAMLRTLAMADLPWSNIHVVQVDERVARVGDPDRNLTAIRENLLQYAPLRPEHIYEMPVGQPDLADAAVQYETTLHALAGRPAILDVVQLGLGADGHTASLIPGSAVLQVNDRDVAAVEPYQGRQRMTLTYPILNRARFVLFLVIGSEKAAMLAKLHAGDRSIPAGRVQAKRIAIIADDAAAREIASKLA